jgi:hypothetical protein
MKFLRSMSKWFGLLLALFVMSVFSAPAVFAAGMSNKTISGVYDQVEVEAKTVTASGTIGCSASIDDCMVFYLRPYDLPATLDLIVQGGANSYTATYSFKIAAAAANKTTEFGPFYMNPFESINWYMGLTPTGSDASSTCTVYIRSYNPTKHNY